MIGSLIVACFLAMMVILLTTESTKGGTANTAGPVGAGKGSTKGWYPAVVQKPRIRRMFIPFGPKRKRQMARYSKRHYGKYDWRLRQPRQIVQHVAAAGSVRSIYRTFAKNRRDPEFGELPNVCAHYAIARSGRVYQYVKPEVRCRHVIGLNHVTIGIEHVGYRDGEVLSRRRQMRSSVRLTRWLRCTYGISVRNVIGHAESLRSRFYRERIKRFKGQTHSDFRRSSMRVYRKKLRRGGLCFVRDSGQSGGRPNVRLNSTGAQVTGRFPSP